MTTSAAPSGRSPLGILLLGQGVSQLGTQFTFVALPLTVVLVLHGTAAEMGALATAQLVPYLLFGLPAGVWVDRARRRRVLILANTSLAILLGSVPLAALAGTLTLYQLYVVGFGVGTANVFFDVAYQSFVPSVVDRTDLLRANSRLEVTRSVAEISGPPIAGVLVQIVTAPLVIALDAISYLFAAAMLARIRVDERLAERGRASMVSAIREGLALIGKSTVLRAIVAYTATSNLFWSLLNTLYPLYVVAQLGLSPAVYGLILATGSAAGIAGALLTAPAAARFGIGRAILVGAFLTRLGFVPVPLATLAPAPLAIALLAFGQIAWGLGIPIYNVNQLSLRQAIAPHQMLGRMSASFRFIALGTRPLGAALAGLIGTSWGVVPATVVALVGSIAGLAWLLASPTPRLRDTAEAAASESVPA